MDRDLGSRGGVFERAGLWFTAAAGRPVRLGQDGDRRKAMGKQFVERNDRKVRCPGEQDAQGVGMVHPVYSAARVGFCPATFRCFSSFLATMRRLSGDR